MLLYSRNEQHCKAIKIQLKINFKKRYQKKIRKLLERKEYRRRICPSDIKMHQKTQINETK